ncbi:MAG: FAD:protein FMN transferase [Clostridia bacterium]|nr:FAD:protein FMN transferase [Clostridia bacterium]
MKINKKLFVLPVACIALACTVGCSQKSYAVYTNIPQGGYEIIDKNYKLTGEISGYTKPEKEFTEVDTSAYTSKRRLYYSMMSDAELVVSADFSAAGAEDKFTAFAHEVGGTLNAIDSALSTSVANSDITLFNEAAPGAQIEIREITYEVLGLALSVNAKTGGYYNPALYYNIYAYGFGGAHNYPQNKSELPSDEVIEKYTALATHFGEITLSEAAGKYYALKPTATVEVGGETLSLKLDLGGIGKGYAVDKVDELFDEYGYKYGHFNFAASSMLVKSNLLQGEYEIRFGSPRSPSRDPYFSVFARNEKLSTSGDNEQKYIIDGTRYCHIIDPTTGKPVQTGIMSATVIGGSAAEADALTTAIMAMGKERAVQFIETELKDKRVFFCCE